MNRAVIVTGAAGGIGAALCERMRKDGYITIGIDRNDALAADIHLKVDLGKIEQLVDVGRELARDYELKAIVHNGAVQPIGGAGETPWEEWANALRVNVIAVDALISGARENLAANDGSVVVISSVHGRATSGGITAYATTKAALEGWVRWNGSRGSHPCKRGASALVTKPTKEVGCQRTSRRQAYRNAPRPPAPRHLRNWCQRTSRRQAYRNMCGPLACRN